MIEASFMHLIDGEKPVLLHSQAALAPVALDLVRQKNRPEYHELANIVLIVSVLAIVLTAPLGAILMVKFAPKFLTRAPNDG